MKKESEALYDRYKALFKDERFPLAFVDLDCFDRNVAYVARTQEKTGKTIRVASKSIRSPDLIKRVFDQGKDAYKGILAFTMEEAGFLSDNGFDDIVVAYPSVQKSDLALFVENVRKGANICLMADSLDHLSVISKKAEKEGLFLNVGLDMDMSFRPLGSLSHLGVRRSPLHTPKEVLDLAKAAMDLPGIRIKGLMGYEAQIASVNDDLPSHRLLNQVKNRIFRAVKKFSVNELTRRRGRIVKAIRDLGISLEFVNGGGSGSLVSTGQDESVTEVTAGSAFFAPGLFRYFHEVSFEPSAFFALQVTRIPKNGIVTCQGGGYTGSGEVNKNRLPWPFLPEGLSYLPMEGAGEVQTPLKLPKNCRPLAIGDPVFFQHAKAGELCERFNHLYLVKDNRIIGTAATYRGLGHAFL